MRLLLIILTFLLCLPLQAQKKLKEGQFFYDLYVLNSTGEKEGVGKAVLLQRGDQQRFEVLLNNFIGPQNNRLQTLLNPQENSFEYYIYNDKGRPEEEKKGELEQLKKMLTEEMTKNLSLTTDTKFKGKIEGYTAEKATLTNEGLGISWNIYHTNKIQIQEHGFYFTMIPRDGLDFLLKAELNIPSRTEKLIIELSEINAERPNEIWFNLEKLPLYPFEATSKEEDNSVINSLTDLFWHSTTSEQEALRAYHSALSNSLLNQESNLNKSLQTLSDQREEINIRLKEFVDNFKFHQNPNENFYTNKILTEEKINQLEEGYKTFINLIHETLQPLIEKPSQLNELYEKLLSLQPKKQFGSTIEDYHALTGKQAIALLRSYENLTLLMEIEGLQALAKALEVPFESTSYRVMAFSPKPYILLGETYEAEIGLAQTLAPKEMEVTVNGRRLAYKNGKAIFKDASRSIGEKRYTASITFRNPATGETEKVQQEMSYEVGVTSTVVAADKMNVFYVGVDNPISVAAAGVTSKDISVTVSGGGGATIKQTGIGKYTILATKPSSAGNFCIITIRDKKRGKVLGSFPFRVKWIPDPVAKLTNNKAGGTIKAGEMRAQRGLVAILLNFDFDAKCRIHSFDFQRVHDGKLEQEIHVEGGLFVDEALRKVQSAASGDIYLFQNIKARCPGDTAARNIGSMNFVVQ